MNEPSIMLSSWGGAQYLDWWMLVHFLAGLTLGYLCRILGINLLHTVIIVGAVLVCWEVYERMAHIKEPTVNGFIDLIVGGGGIWVATLLPLTVLGLGKFVVAAVLLVAWAGLSLWGWTAWKARESKNLEIVHTQESMSLRQE